MKRFTFIFTTVQVIIVIILTLCKKVHFQVVMINMLIF